MTKEQLIAMGLTEEQANKVMSSLNDNFVTKKRFNELNDAKKQLEKDVETRDGQLEELKKVDAAGLQAQIEKLQGDNAANKAKYESDVEALKIDGLVNAAVTGAKARNVKAVKALLNLEGVKREGEIVVGLADQLKALQEGAETKFLFGEKEVTGFKPGGQNEQPKDKPLTLKEAIAAKLQ